MSEEKIKNHPINIRNYVFIPKKLTEKLVEYIEKENWDENNKQLFTYLDYNFRIQLMNKQLKIIEKKGKQKLIFNTGLFKRTNNEQLFMVCDKNCRNNVPWKLDSLVNALYAYVFTVYLMLLLYMYIYI